MLSVSRKGAISELTNKTLFLVFVIFLGERGKVEIQNYTKNSGYSKQKVNKTLYLQGFLLVYLRIFYYSDSVSRWSREQKSVVGFVPTMGALHEGHLSLVREAAGMGPVLVSIFVNPAQFNNKEDLAKYPRTLESDLQKLKSAGTDAVFIPREEDIYPPELTAFQLDLGRLDETLEGAFRKGHFQGVVKILHRLFEVVRPGRVFFGLKDLQQCMVAEILIRKHFPQIEQHNSETVREQNGLAMSSRNARLSDEGKTRAANIFKALSLYRKDFWPQKELVLNMLKTAGIDTEYLEVINLPDFDAANNPDKQKRQAVLFAGYLEGVRLIDNLILNTPG
jgi:pantoate--beta-alanine ligase